MTRAGDRPLRRDAAENAERLLAAAVRSGLARGSQVPMADIAAEAGVGVGTLYRRYRDRDSLLLALQVRAFEMLVAIAEEALAGTTTGLAGVEQFLVRSYAIRDQLVLPLHGAPLRLDEAATRGRTEIRRLLTAIVERGHEDGTVRDDVTAWTVVHFGAMLAQPMTGTEAEADGADAQRAVFLRGIQP